MTSDAPAVRPDALARVGTAFFKYRDALFPVVLIAAAFGTRPRLAGTTRTDHLMDAVGFAVSAAGQGLRVLVVGLVYITRGGQNRRGIEVSGWKALGRDDDARQHHGSENRKCPRHDEFPHKVGWY